MRRPERIESPEMIFLPQDDRRGPLKKCLSLLGQPPELAVSPETEQTPQARIIYVRGEILSLPEMFEFYLQQKLEKISESFEVVPALTIPPQPFGTEGTLTLSSRKIPLNHWRGLTKEIAKEEELRPSQRKVLERMTNYFSHCQTRKKGMLQALAKMGISFYLYNRLIEIAVRHYGQPDEALRASSQLLDIFLERKIDPITFQRNAQDWAGRITRMELIKKCYEAVEGEKTLYKSLVETGPRVIIRLPVSREEWLTFKCPLGVLRTLEKNKVSIAIVGPANSGKSTLTACLSVEGNKLIDQAKSHVSLADLRLRCDFMDLDSQRPDVAEILKESEGFNRPKTPWTDELALTTAEEFAGQEGNIIIADAPGGNPDRITDIVLGPADLTILLIAADNDEVWQKKHDQWRMGLKKIGRTPVVLLRSRQSGEISSTTGEELKSSITSFRWTKADSPHKKHRWIERIGGRVIGLNRKVLGDNPCISALAKLLLLNLLPQIVIERKEQTQIHLNQLLNEQTLLMARRSYFGDLREKLGYKALSSSPPLPTYAIRTRIGKEEYLKLADEQWSSESWLEELREGFKN